MSQDHFLSKVYESVLNKTATPSNKPQNLKQAYYRVVLEQINEDTDVSMQNKDEEGKPIGDPKQFSVSDNVANKIRSEIRKEMSTEIDGKKINVTEIVDGVLRDKLWAGTREKNTGEYFELLQKTLQVFADEDLVLENFKNYKQLANQKNSLVEQQLSDSLKIISLQSLIPDWFNNFFENKNGLSVASKLFEIKTRGKTSVGKGELMFTLISDSKKGTIGDLYFKSIGQVEVKGLGGTMGGDGFVNKLTPTLLNNIYTQTSNTKTTLPEKILNRAKQSIKNTIENILKERETLKRKRQEIDLNGIRQIITKLDEPESLDEFETLIDASNLTKKQKNDIKSGIEKVLKIKEKKIKNEYRSALESFFTSYKELTDEQLTEGILSCRSYENLPLEELRKTIFEKVSTNKAELFSEIGLTKKFDYLITALHIVGYQKAKDFSGILFMNDRTKNMIYYSFDKEASLGKKLNDIFNFLIDKTPAVYLTMSEQAFSVGISFSNI